MATARIASMSGPSLQIRLTEPVVYLKDVDFSGRRHTHNENSAPSMVRGLLVLTLAKPTRISSVEIELQGKSSMAWPEGGGARRIEVTEERKLFSATTVYFRADSGPTSYRRAMSVEPGLRHYQDENEDTVLDSDDEPEGDLSTHRGRHGRRASVDPSMLQRDFVSHEESLNLLTPASESPHISPSSSVSNLHSAAGIASTPSSHSDQSLVPPTPGFRQLLSTSPLRSDESPSRALEDFRRILRSDLNTASRRSSLSPGSQSARLQMLTAVTPPSSILSRHDSVSGHAETNGTRFNDRSRSTESSIRSPVRVNTEEDGRGRHNKKFSLSLVTNALFDRVRSNSPLATRSRERSTSESQDSRREVSRETGKARESRSALIKVSEVLGLDNESGHEHGAGWKEFKRGTYTYPISFSVPADSPPSLHLDHGSVVWRLKATAHRPGTFTTKLMAIREVIIVASPSDDDIEDTENIMVERTWDDQMHYLLLISGRCFAIGGAIPIQMTIMPLAKVKIHRIGIILEETVSYHPQMRRITKTDVPKRIMLLSIKYPDTVNRPILPLSADDVDVFRTSPLYPLLVNGDSTGTEDHSQSYLADLASELASNLMGPGPWTIQFDAKLPKSCSDIHPTNANKKSGMTIHHTLKTILRVERGDDNLLNVDGKRKMFDIVIQNPVHILSCLCNQDYTLLPRYSESCVDSTIEPVSCGCGTKGQNRNRPHAAGLNPQSLNVTDGSTRNAETSAVVMPQRYHGDNAVGLSTQYERLITGQESEVGEAPPSYHVATQTRA